MPAFDAHLAGWFHDHHGIIGSSDLKDLGISDEERRHLLLIGVLESPFEGVYRLTSTPLDFRARCAAVCAADASLVLSCYTAGTLLGLRKCGSAAIHATTDRLTKPVGRRVVIHRTRHLPPEHIAVRSDGIRHTTPERAFFDLAKHVSDLTLTSIGEQMLHDGLCAFESLVQVALQLAARGRPGSARALRVLTGRSASGEPADSHDEVRLLAALHAAGMVDFVRHPSVGLLDGSVVHPDLGVPALGFYVEVDHHTWHDPTAAADYDKDRDRQVRLAGGVVERVTDTQLRDNLPKVVADLRTLYLGRRSSFGVQAG
ncbi:MAG: hypothetical protein F2681_10985 [Actinobacteria bacterium]|jgi:hypothetical protein|uniref:Unannotated protein n=1 Tax=freshwater metagenome TaxID=449393 RepID=A0A6J6A6F4_9ZZZZ|nr:hypothetical protein [Actinomycetota bacterium]MSW77248.1 hypothetical protein [Actinomycetota bacterium]MSZ83651.1 hypothetical protein [Actinomycetota bacterium]MTB17352.1 hypothetical protein [Actinomycetota bacterium]